MSSSTTYGMNVPAENSFVFLFTAPAVAAPIQSLS
jgi:hypothetical protein